MSAVTGTPQRWARDFALIGGTTSAVGPVMAMAFGVPVIYAAAAVAAGVLSGGLLGAGMPGLLERVRGRVPLVMLVALGPLLGALWGGSVGVLASAVTDPNLLGLSVLAASAAGAIQFGVSWFPYTFQTVRGGRVWPVVLAACLLTPVVGFLSIITTLAVVL